MVRSSFWFVRQLAAAAAGLLVSIAAPAEPVSFGVVEVTKKSAGEEIVTLGIRLSTHPGLIVSVASSVEEKATFTATAQGLTCDAAVALFEPNSRLLLLTPAQPLAGAPVTPLAAAVAPAGALAWPTAAGLQPAVFAGPVRQLDGRPLALTLERVHFASGSEALRPRPGTPVVTADGHLVALALSPLPDDAGAWLCLPGRAAEKVLADFAAVGHAETGLLEFGLAIGTSTPRLEFVKPGSRAEKAALAPGDIVLALDNRVITDVFDVLDANFYLTTRAPVTLRILRGVETLSLTAPAVSKSVPK